MGRGLAKAEELMHPWSRVEWAKLVDRFSQNRETFMREYIGTFVGVDPAMSEDRTPKTASAGVAYLLRMSDAQLECAVRRMVSGFPMRNFRCVPLHDMSPMESAMVREGSTTACSDCGVLVDTGAVYQSVKDANRLLCESCFHGAERGGRARERKPENAEPVWLEETASDWR